MRRWPAATVYLMLQTVSGFAAALMFTTYALYYIRTLHLGPLELVLVGTALEASYYLCELPTGALADARGRRPCLIAGTAILGLAYSFEGSLRAFSGPVLPLLLGAEAVRGLGEALCAGAAQAWIAGEIGDARAGALYLRAAQWQQGAGLFGTLAGVGLALLALNLPYVVGGLLFLALAGGLAAAMREDGFRPTPRALRQALPAAAGQALRAVRAAPLLWLLLGAGVFAGASSEGGDRLWPAQLLHTFGLPAGRLGAPVWFGLLALAGQALGLCATSLARRVLDPGDAAAAARGLVACAATRLICLLGMGLAPGFWWAAAAYLGLGAAGAVQAPLSSAWLNTLIRPQVRATVLSMLGQADALGQAAGGPAVGLVGRVRSLRAAMVLAAALLLPSVLAYGRGAAAPAAFAD